MTMYPEVKRPKKVTEKWIKQAFAPLSDYLRRNNPDEVDRIMAYIEFFGNKDNRFYYRNIMSKGSIIMDQSGQLVRCDHDALLYDFVTEISNENKPAREPRSPHPNVTRWMEERLSRREARKHGADVSRFLQEFWGPIVNYQFGMLRAGYPKLGARVPYSLPLYDIEQRVVLLFAGDEIVEQRCKYEDYYKFQQCEGQLAYLGWQVITVYREIFDEDPDMYEEYVRKVVQLVRRFS
ncbi:hypothetical protein RB620_23640 [Paenibacillus sp. LHD-117]|uniref:hypothetical protein n=1 Tax=Paenibacillus sp. LHD-117 TaxID=3071412 RepID=UPI0027E14567|nr:hypothetical protein [Paenibacillus sp. LHD-117]MDQ6422428.1 hypothetical protein [Paenibacillus sp. LHD-117]